jgi:DNA-binding NarL/FixJ family response regulator
MPNSERNYVAIIGDLVGSRAMSAERRAAVQEQFESVLDAVNQKFKSEIASLFLITAGDEAQGILKQPHCCYELIREVQIGLAPAEIVFGVGYGALSTPLSFHAVGADGPTFHLASKALTDAKAERKAYGKSILREVRVATDSPLRDDIINSLLLSLSVIKSRWTKKQAAVLAQLEQGKSNAEAAAILKIPPSNVSRTIDATRFRDFQNLAATVRMLFRDNFTAITNIP